MAKPREIIYVGRWTASTDRSYDNFSKALRSRLADTAAAISISYASSGADGDEAMEQAIDLALLRKPALLITPTGASARIARRLNSPIPMVFASYVDPVALGIVSSMGRRKEPVTGVTLADWLDEKRFELLHEAFPEVRTVAVLADRSWAENYDVEHRIPIEARRHALAATVLYAESETEFDALAGRADVQAFDAWYIPPNYIAYLAEKRIIDTLARMRKPAIHATTHEVDAGALMAYAQDTSFVPLALADLVTRVLSGEPPGSIPIERPRRYVLSVRTAPGSPAPAIASSVVRRADLVF